jgi:putative hydrolase of the HAD superfamily
MSKKLIIFDADGVVIRSEMFSVWYQKLFGVSNEVMQPFFTGEFQDCLVGKADIKDLLPQWLPQWKWPGTLDQFLNFWFQVENKLDLSVIQSIFQLRSQGYICVLATQQEQQRVNFLRTDMQFEVLFDSMYASCEMKLLKKQPEFFQRILEDQGVSADQALFFDDTEKNVMSARTVGIEGKVVTNVEQDYFPTIAGLI